MRGAARLLRGLAAALAAVALAAPACSSSSSGATSCNAAPWECAAGTTCWPQCECTSKSCTLASCSLQFSCLPSGVLTEGQSCSLEVGAQKAVCTDGLTCVSFADAGAGSCRPYCDQHQGCATGETCVELSVSAGMSSATERVCVPPAIAIDGGLMIGDSGSGGGGSPSDARLDISFDGGGPDGTMMQ